MWVVAIAAAWVCTGALAVAVLRRRGHDTFAWAIVFMALGPLALPLAVSADRHRPPEPSGQARDGELDVLFADDGSAEASAALDTALRFLGANMTSITFAAVVDFEAATTVRGRETVRRAQERLEAFARDTSHSTSAPTDTVVLYGDAAHTLEQFAAEHGYELIVTGSHGAAHLVGRKITRKPAVRASVPVLVGPSAR